MDSKNYKAGLQRPLNSGYDRVSVASDIISSCSLKGRIAVVTGGYSGIGLETTRVLAAAGATVIVPAKDINKAKNALAGIVGVEIEDMNLRNPQSIEAFAAQFLATKRPLHLLINNAGIMWAPLERDSRGVESQLSVNYLGHFQLTCNLWPALKKAKGARVVNVSSFSHHLSPFNFKDPNFEHRVFDSLLAYGQSKSACNLFTVELDKRGKPFQIRAYAVNPGSVGGTGLSRKAPDSLFQQFGSYDSEGAVRQEVFAKLKTIPQAAATTVWCATSSRLSHIGGVYCEDADLAASDLENIEYRHDDPSTLTGVQPDSLDEVNAAKLWKWSEKIMGIAFETN